jgi:hypothetical protein
MTITEAPAPSGAPAAQDTRAAWFRDVYRVLAATETHDSLPQPMITKTKASFSVCAAADPRRALAQAEELLSADLGVTFEVVIRATALDRHWFILAAALPGGLTVEVCAWAADVAELRTTGRELADRREWVRLPAGAAA